MTTQSNPTNEELPHHLQALLDLSRETEPSLMRAWLHDYKRTVGLTVGYGAMAFLVGMNGDIHAAPILFFAIITIMFSLNADSEQQARRRWKLLLEVLWNQARFEKNAADQEVSKS